MHTIPELGTGVPAFLAKLWKLVEDPETDDLICWSPSGRSFYIRNQAQFARELLPHYYKHNNMASFVRQLNMYGFHKKVSVELGGLKCDRDEMEFAHQYFYKDHPYLVEHIKRKIASNKGQDPALTPIKPELMNKMLTEVRSMRGRQEHLDSRLGAMKRENEALWREIAMLRQKHLKQQQIVNKLIHFLVTLVQPSRSAGLSVKRRYPLMIDDSNHQCKENKISKVQKSPTGPVIHELDSSEPDLDSQYIVAEILENQSHPAIESPEHPSDQSFIDGDGMETIQLADDAVHFKNDDISLEMDTKKKRPCKGKKKRKNKMPVKILIPPTENGQESREEIHFLEIPTVEDSPVTVTLLENNSIASKPVPLATVRSSKLAAMAANMSKSNEVETDVDLETTEIDDDIQDTNPSLEKLKDILIVPEVINNNDLEIDDNRKENSDNNSDNESIRLHNDLINMNKEQNILDEDNQIVADKSKSSNLLEQQKYACNKPDRSDPIDLSLSCVNPSGISDANYRLGSMEEMDNHLETMQSELENLRDILRGEGYSIDANTLLGLFGTDDSSMPFGISVNSDLDTNDDREDDKSAVADSLSGNGGGELMAYNPASNLLDFDDDIFLNATAASPINNSANDVSSSNLYASDPLDLEDSKASFLESYVGSNENDS